MNRTRARLKSFLKSVPIIRASWSVFQKIRIGFRHRWLPAKQRWLDRWIHRLPSEVVKSNTRKAFDFFYSHDEFVETNYLRDSRLEFFDCVADYCAPELAILGSTPAGYRLMDVGCGTGHFLLSLQKRLDSATGSLGGLDFSSVAIARARELLPDASFSEADIYSIPYADDQYDVVTCIETLEHLKKPELALSELARICKPSGRLVITVPDSTDDWEGHRNFWTTETLRSYLSPAGVVEIIELPEHGAVLARVTKKSPGHSA